MRPYHEAIQRCGCRPLLSLRKGSGLVPVSALARAVDLSPYDLVSTDLFDTILLRDSTTESGRLALACRRAAPLLGVDATVLTRLRWDAHDNAYRAVAIERPEGDVALSAICRTVVCVLGLGEDAAHVLHQAEVDVDIEHLRPHRALLELLTRASRSGIRVIAVSDTYYSTEDLCRMLDTVVGVHPIAAVYSSAELGLTKHGGRMFGEVERLEDISATRILHMGDNPWSDVTMARAASWTALHVPRNHHHRAAKFAGKVKALPIRTRRSR